MSLRFLMVNWLDVLWRPLQCRLGSMRSAWLLDGMTLLIVWHWMLGIRYIWLCSMWLIAYVF